MNRCTTFRGWHAVFSWKQNLKDVTRRSGLSERHNERWVLYTGYPDVDATHSGYISTLVRNPVDIRGVVCGGTGGSGLDTLGICHHELFPNGISQELI